MALWQPLDSSQHNSSLVWPGLGLNAPCYFCCL